MFYRIQRPPQMECCLNPFFHFKLPPLYDQYPKLQNCLNKNVHFFLARKLPMITYTLNSHPAFKSHFIKELGFSLFSWFFYPDTITSSFKTSDSSGFPRPFFLCCIISLYWILNSHGNKLVALFVKKNKQKKPHLILRISLLLDKQSTEVG